MAILDRNELEQSPLADLHAIASELGIEGYRRLRREELIDALLAGGNGSATAGDPRPEAPPARRGRGGGGGARRREAEADEADSEPAADADAGPEPDSGAEEAEQEPDREPATED